MSRIELGAYVLTEQIPGSRSAFIAHRTGDSMRYVVKTAIGSFERDVLQSTAESLSRELNLAPHLCSIIEVGVQPHIVYAVAPFLEGANLGRIIRQVHERGSMALTSKGAFAATFLIGELAIAYFELLESLSGNEDIKFSPDTAFVCKSGGVRVLDPRWVRLRSMFRQPASSRSLAHELAYYLPQHHQAFVRKEDEPVWGLSVALWELLTGYRLFRRESLVETLHALTKADIPDPREFNLHVPEALAEWLMETLQYPERRSLAEYSEELAHVAHGSALGGSLALEEWLMDLDANFEEDARVDQEEGNLNALLEGDTVTWTSNEASTTYTSGPPSMPDVDPADLEWLEEDSPLSVVPVVTARVTVEREEVRAFRKAFLAIPLLLVLLPLVWRGDDALFDGVSSADYGGTATAAAAAAPQPNPYDSGLDACVGSVDLHEEARVVELADVLIDAPMRTVLVDASSEKHPRPEKGALVSEKGQRIAGQALSATDERSPYGFLAIDGPPELTVFIDGRVLGKGRFQTQLPVGSETLRFVVSGREDQLVQVRIKPGAQTHVALRDSL